MKSVSRQQYNLVLICLIFLSCISAYLGLDLMADKVRASKEFLSPYSDAIVIREIEPEFTEYIDREVPRLPQTTEEIIRSLWGDRADDAIAVFSCESGLRASATHKNTNGTVDVGIAQINSVHGIKEKWLKNPYINLYIAYQLWQDQGFNPWVCARKLGVK